MGMFAGELSGRRILGVSELTEYLKSILDNDRILRNVWIKGEISNFKHHSSGHLYFTLKDQTSSVKTVMFRSKAGGLIFRPENGMRVLVRGYVTVFPRDGVYQLYAEELEPDGRGSLHLAFEQLKKRLEAEGLFDKSQKKPLPPFPQRIGLVTSPTGAAIRDLLNVMRRRNPRLHIIIVPVAVQGDEAPNQIAQGIAGINQWARMTEGRRVDVIIAGRGGGSLEDLWAFNTEVVARAIRASSIPVVSAVGHETDVTIADFVADLRAPTPSAAAELVVPDLTEINRTLDSLGQRLFQGLRHQFVLKQKRLEAVLQRGGLTRPKDRIYQLSQIVDSLDRELKVRAQKALEAHQARLGGLAAQLQALSPLATLGRGYSLTLRSDNRRRLNSVSGLQPGDRVVSILADGELDCTIDEVRGEKYGQDKKAGN